MIAWFLNLVVLKLFVMKRFLISLLFITNCHIIFSQALLESNTIIHGKNWKKSNDKFFEPLAKIEFDLAKWPQDNYLTRPSFLNRPQRELDSIKIGFKKFRGILLEPLKKRKTVTIESIKSDTAKIKKLIEAVNKDVAAINESIGFVANNTDTAIEKEKLLSKEFANQLTEKKEYIQTNLEQIKSNYMISLSISQQKFSDLEIDSIKSYDDWIKTSLVLDSMEREVTHKREKLKKATEEIENAKTEINTKLESYKKSIKPDNKDDNKNVSVLPALNAKLGKRELLPNIMLIGEAKLGEDGKAFGDIRLFTGAGGNPKNLVTLENLLFQEFSAFGFISNFSYAFLQERNKKNKLAINFGVNYLGKNLQKSDTSDFNTSVFHFKLGGEYAIDPNKLSLYINFNRLTIADNVAKFEKEFNMSNKLIGFTDFGAKLKLNMLNAQSTYLDIDLGFIANTNDVKKITNTSDLVLPRIKIGITQKLIK
jgi:hypothetical protein